MNIESLETLWNTQRPTDARRPDPAELSRRRAPAFRRPRRFFGYELFCLGLGLVLTPLLAVVNYLHQQPENPVLYWLRVAVFVTVVMAVLVGAIRRLRRHRALAQARSDTVAAFAAKALANIEDEARDYRAAFRGLPLWLGLALLAIYVNHPVPTHGWEPLLLRLGMTLAFLAMVGAVYAWHYHKHLMPELARRKQLLEQLS